MRALEVACDVCKVAVDVLCDLNVVGGRVPIGRFHNERVMKAGAEERIKNKKKREAK